MSFTLILTPFGRLLVICTDFWTPNKEPAMGVSMHYFHATCKPWIFSWQLIWLFFPQNDVTNKQTGTSSNTIYFPTSVWVLRSAVKVLVTHTIAEYRINYKYQLSFQVTTSVRKGSLPLQETWLLYDCGEQNNPYYSRKGMNKCLSIKHKAAVVYVTIERDKII